MQWRVGAVGVVAIVAFAAISGALSCRQIVGIMDNPPADLSTNACGLPYGTTTCASCASTSCCAESNACVGDPDFCAPYESCLGACNGDPACRSKCTIDHPVPAVNAAPVSALSACLVSHCEDECGLACGGFAGYLSMPDAATGCASCLEKNGSGCSDERACGTSAECDTFWRCWLACPTPDCQWACAPEHDAGAATFRPLQLDFAGACAAECGYGAYWACAGHIEWPAAKSSTVENVDVVYDFSSQSPVAGATVSVCAGCPCPQPNTPLLAQGSTDDAGVFTLAWQQQVSPAGIGSTYCWQVTAPGYLPTFAYSTDPISEPRWSNGDYPFPNGKTTVGLALVTPAAQQENANASGYDGGRGTLGVGVFDCLFSPADGVEVTIDSRDPMMTPTVAPDGGPEAGATSVTAGGGRAYFLNVPDGGYTLTVTLPNGQPVSQANIQIAGGTLSEIQMHSTQSP